MLRRYSAEEFIYEQRTQLWWGLPLIESLELLRYVYRVPKVRFAENLKWRPGKSSASMSSRRGASANFLLEINRERGATALLATHDTADIAHLFAPDDDD